LGCCRSRYPAWPCQHSIILGLKVILLGLEFFKVSRSICDSGLLQGHHQLIKSADGPIETLWIEIAVSATGKVTKCEARINRNASVTNLGPGWHDKFVKI
jgi:hypothetical protein